MATSLCSHRTVCLMGSGQSRSSKSHGYTYNNEREHDNRTMTTKNETSPNHHRLPPGSFFSVDLTLMDVSGEANEDSNAIQLLRNIKGGIWETACFAKTYLKQPGNFSTEEAKDVQKRVSRFLKTNDKFMAFSSMLFKSRYFHEISSKLAGDGSSACIENPRRPMVELPTTQYRKPYIPLPVGWSKSFNHPAKEEDIFSFSVSHQFPFVGFAKIKHQYRKPITKQNEKLFLIGGKTISLTIPPPIVGLDIVVFEKINPRLYSSEDEFLEVFRDQFTSNEWENGIQNPQFGTSTLKMNEFYVRWAMKEAYTKAIGVGMGLEFKSFEIHLEGKDDVDFFSGASTWKCIHENRESTINAKQPVCFRGTIMFANGNEKEYFYFYFLPLVSKSANIGSDESMEGCACVCVGSFDGRNQTGEDDKWMAYIDISWTDLEALVQSHWNSNKHKGRGSSKQYKSINERK